ncbi:hypothetical protein SAMN05880558_12125 [Aeromonas sp. RU39B]|uniref:hypothetical protein n=1 Tax=Aeromonas sp. RU39B TaxID=1907416 RepID=UPI0009564FF6|nr:hypothetical protein [Aeromonas sp. RU39B]SIR63582.1 hypothetical protein SAMN05880558_12125 [Aeromonas sp. RU39B]
MWTRTDARHVHPARRARWWIGFCGLWLRRGSEGWSLWLERPHSKTVHLTRLLHSRNVMQPGLATVIPIQKWQAKHEREQGGSP